MYHELFVYFFKHNITIQYPFYTRLFTLDYHNFNILLPSSYTQAWPFFYHMTITLGQRLIYRELLYKEFICEKYIL